MRVIRYIAIGLGGVIALLALVYALMWRGDIAYRTLEARYGAPTSHYLDLPDGVRLHYRDEGEPKGPVVMLLHGYSASSVDWDDWVSKLGSTYRIIAPDMPGHGLTRAPTGYRSGSRTQVNVVDDLVKALHLAPFVIGGNSMGGGIAWRYTLAHPERIKGLLLVDAAGWPAPKEPHQGALAFQILANPLATAALRNLDNTSLVKQGLEAAMVDQSKVTPAMVRRYAEFSRAPGHRDILTRRPLGPDDAATVQRLGLIAVPTLIMFGDQDRIIAPIDGQRFKDAIPGSTLIIYRGLGHVPMEQNPDLTAADLSTWLAKVETQPVSPPAHQITTRELPPPNPPH